MYHTMNPPTLFQEIDLFLIQNQRTMDAIENFDFNDPEFDATGFLQRYELREYFKSLLPSKPGDDREEKKDERS